MDNSHPLDILPKFIHKLYKKYTHKRLGIKRMKKQKHVLKEYKTYFPNRLYSRFIMLTNVPKRILEQDEKFNDRP